MKILVLNSGSSSLKCQYFIDRQSIASLSIERIGENSSHTHLKYAEKIEESSHAVIDHHHALDTVFHMLKEAHILSNIEKVDAVGHRVVHGGDRFKCATVVNKEVIENIRALIPLAPLHNPANLDAIEILHTRYPTLKQVAVFDTAFHQNMPEYAALYPLPYTLSKSKQIRRYGFHGTSHAYVAKEATEMLQNKISETPNLITLHLGNGASVTAIRAGKSIDTSMGMTPLEGLMMGTRAGDIDAAIIPYLVHHSDLSLEEIETLLNKESGLKGICGTNDMREVLNATKEDDPLSQLALKMYVYRIQKYIGAYTVALRQVDAIVFTGGIGEHASEVRELICQGLDLSIGLKIDPLKNENYTTGNQMIHAEESRISLFVIPTNEELEIVRQTEALIG